MKFPISVEHIEDQIVLFLGYISEDFKEQLHEFNDENDEGAIQSVGEPDLSGIIYINGTCEHKNYQIKSRSFSASRFNEYKIGMGYE